MLKQQATGRFLVLLFSISLLTFFCLKKISFLQPQHIEVKRTEQISSQLICEEYVAFQRNPKPKQINA